MDLGQDDEAWKAPSGPRFLHCQLQGGDLGWHQGERSGHDGEDESLECHLRRGQAELAEASEPLRADRSHVPRRQLP